MFNVHCSNVGVNPKNETRRYEKMTSVSERKGVHEEDTRWQEAIQSRVQDCGGTRSGRRTAGRRGAGFEHWHRVAVEMEKASRRKGEEHLYDIGQRDPDKEIRLKRVNNDESRSWSGW